MDAPSMVQRSGDSLIIRSVVSGNQIFFEEKKEELQVDNNKNLTTDASKLINIPEFIENNTQNKEQFDVSVPSTKLLILDDENKANESELPQCKIKRNYSCNSCNFFTQNPRFFLTHLRDKHGEKININSCKLCLYASRHYQKLVRHMKMVHGSIDGISENSSIRKKQFDRDFRRKKTNKTFDEFKNPLKKLTKYPREKLFFTLNKNESSRSGDDNKKKITSEQILKNRIFKCSICDFSSLIQSQLLDHESVEHHNSKFFRCEKCNYVTHIKARFSKHVKYHSMPMIKCFSCDFKTPYKWNLDRHMKNHGGMGAFKCSICNFTADIKQSLTVHEMNHHMPNKIDLSPKNLDFCIEKENSLDNDIEMNYHNSNFNYENYIGNEDKWNSCINERENDIKNENQYNELSKKKINQSDGSLNSDECINNSTKWSNDDVELKNSYFDNSYIIQSANKKSCRPIPNLIPIQDVNSALPSNNESLIVNKNNFMSLNETKNKLALRNKIASEIFKQNCNYKFSDIQSITQDQITLIKLNKLLRKSIESVSNEDKKNFEKEQFDCMCDFSSNNFIEFENHKLCCQINKVSVEQKFEKTCEHNTFPINLSVQNNSLTSDCQKCKPQDLSNNTTRNNLFLKSQEETIVCNDNDEEDMDGSSNNVLTDQTNITKSSNSICEEAESYTIKDINENKSPKKTIMDDGENNSLNFYGVETAPGYGEVTRENACEEDSSSSVLKKVYKCPHCSFWASTASRFHVHIVGHLNKKPFECSLCNYRSNWRWDITKHIRLKTIRDPSHKNARVLMNDETGRRNYAKYNKYITLMTVSDSDGDPKLMKSGEMTPGQEASISLLKEYENQGINPLNKKECFINLVHDMQNDPVNVHINECSESLSSQKTLRDYDCEDKKIIDNDLINLNFDSSPENAYKCSECNFSETNIQKFLFHIQQHLQHGIFAEGFFPDYTFGDETTYDFLKNTGSNPFIQKILSACLRQKLTNDKINLVDLKQGNKNYSSNFMKDGFSTEKLVDLHKEEEDDDEYGLTKKNGENEEASLFRIVTQTPASSLASSMVTTTASLANTKVSLCATSITSSLTKTFTDKMVKSNYVNSESPSNNNFEKISRAVVNTSNSDLTSSSSNSSLNTKTLTTNATSITLTSLTKSSFSQNSSTIQTCPDLDVISKNIIAQNLSKINVENNNQTNNLRQKIKKNSCSLTHSMVIGNSYQSNNSRTNSSIVSDNILANNNLNKLLIKNGYKGKCGDRINNNPDHWRRPSPYRCGHCHQESNWKHVIQRHCRLKHNGNISIETFNRINNDFKIFYAPISNNTSDNKSFDNTQNLLINNMQDNFESDNLTLAENLENNLEKKMSEKIENAYCSNKEKKHFCTQCSFVSQSKSQMNYHLSLHKAPQYMCSKCGSIFHKKQIYLTHMKQIHNEIISAENGISDFKIKSNIEEKTIKKNVSSSIRSNKQENKENKYLFFCHECPSRFLSKDALTRHNEYHKLISEKDKMDVFSCKFCSFNTNQLHLLRLHLCVHSEEYQICTVILLKRYKPAVDHYQPKLEKCSSKWIIYQKNINLDLDEKNSNIYIKCQFCPFESTVSKDLENHVKFHLVSLTNKLKNECEHCDFSTDNESDLNKHLKVHFEKINKDTELDFFTSYSNLELNENISNEKNNDKISTMLYKSIENSYEADADAKKIKKIINLKTGKTVDIKRNFVY